jgi:hypothetical protein
LSCWWQSGNCPLHDSRWISRNFFGSAAIGQLKVEARPPAEKGTAIAGKTGSYKTPRRGAADRERLVKAASA